MRICAQQGPMSHWNGTKADMSFAPTRWRRRGNFLPRRRPARMQIMADEPGIALEDSGSKGRYTVHGPDGAVAQMTFTKVGEHQIIIDHTEVPDSFRGQGVGVRLVQRAVEDARSSGKKIIPLCPFAAAQFRRH